MKVVLVCIAKNEDFYLKEWIDYNLKIGFDHIFIYENNWTCSLEHEHLTKIKWDGQSQQLPAYNNFISTYGKDYDWGAFFDCDEFLVLKKHNNIKEFIETYDNPHGICINWKFFGSLGKVNRDGSDSLIKQFTKSQTGVDQHIKTIINFRKTQTFRNPHFTNIPSKDTNGKSVSGPYNPSGTDDVSYIAHYYHKTSEDWDLRVKRGRSDCLLISDKDDWEKEKNLHSNIDNDDVLSFMYYKSES